nr:DUF2770 domain-containing protein [Enterobacter hormaechei]
MIYLLLYTVGDDYMQDRALCLLLAIIDLVWLWFF